MTQQTHKAPRNFNAEHRAILSACRKRAVSEALGVESNTGEAEESNPDIAPILERLRSQPEFEKLRTTAADLAIEALLAEALYSADLVEFSIGEDEYDEFSEPISILRGYRRGLNATARSAASALRIDHFDGDVLASYVINRFLRQVERGEVTVRDLIEEDEAEANAA